MYGDDDDFIVIGLTGRTGSGCTTVASLLTLPGEKIRHSLFSGKEPKSNQDRKDRIILRHFKTTWTPFLLIQVRAVITTFLLDYDVEVVLEAFSSFFVSAESKEKFSELIKELCQPYLDYRSGNADFDVVGYFTSFLPEKCQELRSALGESSFVRIYQAIGKNIRISGSPFASGLMEGQFFSLAERINEIIAAVRVAQRKKSLPTYIVVDAIRNPLEALFFQSRYVSFFLLAVSAPDAERRTRLRAQNYSEDDIKSIDRVEYTARDLDDAEFYSVQDIQACLQRADLYVSNPNVDSEVSKFMHLANQVIKFVSLIKRPGIVAPSAVERCMQIAYTAKLNSGCISRQVGAVVTDENYSVKSIGWNDAPHGQVPCNLRNREDLQRGLDSVAYSGFERNDGKYLAHFVKRSERFKSIAEEGRNNAFCFKAEYNSLKGDKNQVHTRSLHAEENAFLQISKYGGPAIKGGFLFSTASPCELCAKKAYQLGISQIFYIDPYPGIAMTHILEGGANNPIMNLFSGAIGRAFHKLYSPVVAYKDELNALTA